MSMGKWDKRFMELTETVANWSSCYQQNRHVGAVIVKDKRVMTTGYNGAYSISKAVRSTSFALLYTRNKTQSYKPLNTVSISTAQPYIVRTNPA